MLMGVVWEGRRNCRGENWGNIAQQVGGMSSGA